MNLKHLMPGQTRTRLASLEVADYPVISPGDFRHFLIFPAAGDLCLLLSTLLLLVVINRMFGGGREEVLLLLTRPKRVRVVELSSSWIVCSQAQDQMQGWSRLFLVA